MQLIEVADVWRRVASTGSRNAKTGLMADALRAAGADVDVVTPWLCGELRQRRTGVGWATLRDLPPPANVPSLSVREVDAVFEQAANLSGAGSATERARLMRQLFGAATADEQALLRGLVSEELRQGALDAVVIDGIAKATGIDLGRVRRAVMLRGDIAPVAVELLTRGEAGLAAFSLQVGRPIRPMLAATAASVGEAIQRHPGPVGVDAKLDGIRAQVHRHGSEVAVFSRSLDDITGRVPEVVTAVKELALDTAIIDAELLGVASDGRPLPFQQTGSRTATRSGQHAAALRLFGFDLLHLDGSDLIDRPLQERVRQLGGLAPHLLVDRVETTDPVAAEAFAEAQLARGQEGVVVKDLTSVYDAGRRGAAWLKVKPVRTADLVVLAAEWGHGRRTGWLSNLHLGARGPDGQFVMVGKTFKGMTDELLRWQTEALQAIEVRRDSWTVHVQPSLVVEIGYDGVQRSTRYRGGVALRFARVIRYRDDKSADEADTIELLRSQLPG